jgi:Flp pilus assembly protein TadB
MENTYLWAGAAALITGIGIFLIFASFSVPLTAATRRIMDESAGPRLGGMAEGNITRALMVDMSKRIKPEGGDLEERLRRSGWFYKSVAEFHARRILSSLVFAFLGIALAIALQVAFGIQVQVMFVAVAGTVFAALGFFYPDRALNGAINKRREQLKREMGFGLEKISLFLQSGSDLLDALAQTAGLGIFGQACGVIAAQAGTGRPISEVNSMVRDELPITPEFDEFLQLVQTSIAKGQEIMEPFRQRAASMREMLRRAIIEEGQRASIRVTLITSLFVLAASMIVIFVPLIMILEQEGLF